MVLSYVAFITATLTLVQCHDCKDYDLSASDQSLVDMMKHYLHTSRKEECPPGGKPTTSGVTYVRWGKKECPKGVDMVYTGQVGGNHYSNKGGGVNYLCLPNNPENGKAFKTDNTQLFGTEYETTGGHKPTGMKDMHQKEVPCAVCHQRKKSVLLMIPVSCPLPELNLPLSLDHITSIQHITKTSTCHDIEKEWKWARKTCYKGWTSEYSGYLLTDHKTYSSKEYLCVDKHSEPLDNKAGNEDGALLYGISTKCGSLRCPPYKDAVDVQCVVCTK